MSTMLEITCAGKVSTQSINHTICRIGSNPSLELCMAGIADHAATLRVQNGKRSIYNRSGAPVSLGGKRVPPDQTLPWSEGQILQLSDGVQLRLLHDKPSGMTVNPKHSDVQPLMTVGSNSVTEPLAATEKKRSRLTIAGFLIVFATILFSSESNVANQAMDAEFAQVIEALLVAERQPNAGCYQQIRIDLQNAMLCNVQTKRAELVEEVKRILLSKKTITDLKLDHQIHQFVNSYL